MDKKVISLVVAVLMTAAVFAGCGSDTAKETEKPATTAAAATTSAVEAKAEPVTLKYWAYSRWKGINGDEPDGEYGDWQKSVAKAFTDINPNVTIEFEHLPWTGGPEKVNVAIASKTQPDVLEDGTTRFFGYAARNALIPLDDYFTGEELADYIDGAWDLGKYRDGKHYLFPWANLPQFLMINKDLVKKAGAEDLLPKNAERSWNYDEFKTLLKALAKLPDIYPTAIYAGNEQGDSATNSMIWGYGATIFNETYDKIVFNSPEGIKGVEFMQSLIKEKLVMPGAETLKATDLLVPFQQGKIAVFIAGSTGAVGATENEFKAGKAAEFEMDWAQYPTAPGVEMAFYANPVGLAVFRSGNAGQEKTAIEFAKFATNPENSKPLKVVKLFPQRKSVGDLYPGDPLMTWASSIMKYARDAGYPSPAYAQVRAALFPEMQAAYAGTKTAGQALDDFAKKAQEEVDKLK